MCVKVVWGRKQEGDPLVLGLMLVTDLNQGLHTKSRMCVCVCVHI